MDEGQLTRLERLIETGVPLPDRDGYALETITALVGEVRRLRALLEVAAEACRLREITPYLIDLLDAAGYETAPRVPDSDEWLPPLRHP